MAKIPTAIQALLPISRLSAFKPSYASISVVVKTGLTWPDSLAAVGYVSASRYTSKAKTVNITVAFPLIWHLFKPKEESNFQGKKD